MDEGVAVTVMKDGSYAFVAGRDTRGNAGTSIYPDKREGGNIGIIKDPLGDNPQLVAATRPIPESLTNNVMLTGDDKYLVGSYPTLSLGGAAYVFDVEEIIETIETLELKANGEDSDELEVYWLDGLKRGEGSVAFEEGSKREATLEDLAILPIDDINPDISVAADYEIVGGNWVNRWIFGVPSGTNRAPIGIGGNPFGMTSVSVRDFVELEDPVEVELENLAEDETTEDPLKTKLKLKWKFNIEGRESEPDSEEEPENEEKILLGVKPNEVEEINVYVSVFPKGQGLLPKDDKWEGLEKHPLVNDYNPNRVLTAEWKQENATTGVWSWSSGSKKVPISQDSPLPEEFVLPDELRLTAGQTYHWAVEVKKREEIEGKIITGQFNTPLAAKGGSNTFSSVTVLTRGQELQASTADLQIKAIAEELATTGEGLVMQYDFVNNKWYRDTSLGKDYTIPSDAYGKPLVLITGWEPKEKMALKHGFAEAAGDRLFASLVQLDMSLGGSVGQSNKLYGEGGKLVRKPGALFKSPLHFIGFGQGATVNGETIQRLGTFFPDAYNGGIGGDTPDLQMTTIDVPDATQPTRKNVQNLYDPELKVWKNVTFADNYYQQATFKGKAFSGLNIPDSDWNVFLGKPGNSQSRIGFTEEKEYGSHHSALRWYAGTANLSQRTSEDNGKFYRRLGDLKLNEVGQPEIPTWYTPDYKDTPFEHGDADAPWEGIGTGWFYSVLGGGEELRHSQLTSRRTSVNYDNTNISSDLRGDKVRGDSAVPTLFNGNFDALITKWNSTSSIPIPGWSFGNSTLENNITENNLKRFPNAPSNYRLELGGDTRTTKINHNPFVVPGSGNLRFDLSVPQKLLGKNGRLNVSLTPLNSADGSGITKTILLQKADATAGAYEQDKNKIGYGGRAGIFETFYVDIPKKLRGKSAILSFDLESPSGETLKVYLDDVFFGSELLKFGNPTGARADSKSGQYDENYLIEKPQFVLSYNSKKNTPNWVGWQVNKSWLNTSSDRPLFIPDPDLKETGWYQVKHDDLAKTKTKLPDGNLLERGHMTAAEDRTRSEKDYIATFLTTNILPQHEQNNNGPWKSLERHLRKQVTEATNNPEFTIFAGGYGTKEDFPFVETDTKEKIEVPSHVWKVVTKRNDVEDPIDAVVEAYAVIMPNKDIAGDNWKKHRYSIEQLENLLNRDSDSPQYNFLSEIKDSAKRRDLKKRNENPSPPSWLSA